MQQLELFTPVPLTFALFATYTQKAAMYKADPLLYYEMRLIRERIAKQVARAMFIAKVEGDEFSRYPRR